MRRLLINAAEPEETRAAVADGGRLAEYRREAAGEPTLVGNVYKGRVVNLETGVAAAFVDLGTGRNGFLHVSACGAPAGTPIEDLFAVGDEAVVQVTRDAVDAKGPVLTRDVALAGRYLVLLPFSRRGGVSRRLSDDRAQLRELARELEERAGARLILRTAAADAPRPDVLRDLELLQGLWARVRAGAESAPAPVLLHREGDLAARALRDLLDQGVGEVVVDTKAALARARETLGIMGLELPVRLHDGPPLFHAFGLEEQVDALKERTVPLPSGGSLVFGRTEALVAIDVNSGRTREPQGFDETALRTNLEAAAEAARQIRLRNLGGLVAIDFIDLRDPARVREVEQAFLEALREDRARVKTGRLGPFGVLLLTRRHEGEGAGAGTPCPACGGTGEAPEPLEAALRLLRELRARAPMSRRVRARAAPEVAALVRERLDDPRLEVAADPSLPPGRWALDAV